MNQTISYPSKYLLSLQKNTEGKSHPMKETHDTTDKSRELWTAK